MRSTTVERAIAWALEQEGSPTDALRCPSFVEDAYEVPNGTEVFGGSTATESCALYGAVGRSGEPPRGAYVFFDTAGLAEGVERDWGTSASRSATGGSSMRGRRSGQGRRG